MAKNSMIARENKRTRLAKRFAARRAELKAIIKNTDSSYEEREAAQQKLRMATTVNLDLPGTSCAKPPCVVTCPVWSRQAGKLL